MVMSSDLYDSNSELFFLDTFNHKKIYIDIDFLKDIFLGCILLNMKSEDQYKLFLKDLDNLKYRLIENPSILFPNINFGNIAYSDFLNNKSNHNDIFKVAPLTSFFSLFKEYIKKVISINKLANDKDLPNVYININKLANIDKKIILYDFKIFLMKILPINVYLINTSLCDYENLLDFDSYFIYDIKNFIENQNISMLFSELKFINKLIVVPKMINDFNKLRNNITINNFDINTLLKNKAIEEEFKITEAYMDLICNFKFIDAFEFIKE